MPSIEFMVPDLFKDLMVRKEYEFNSYKIVTPMFQAPNDYIKFLIIG